MEAGHSLGAVRSEEQSVHDPVFFVKKGGWVPQDREYFLGCVLVPFLRRPSSPLSLVAGTVQCQEVTTRQERFSHVCHRLYSGVSPDAPVLAGWPRFAVLARMAELKGWHLEVCAEF